MITQNMMMLSFVVLLSLLRLCKSSDVNTICAFIEDCSSSPCDCVSDNDPNCLECISGQGCQECELGYFQASDDQKCVDCSLLSGCTDCQSGIGCLTCNSTQGCVRIQSNLCGVWACDCSTNSPSPSPTATISERFEILMDILYDDALGDVFEQFGNDAVVCIGDDCGGTELFVYFGYANACDEESQRNFTSILPSEETKIVLYSFSGMCKDSEYGEFLLNGAGYLEYDDNGKIVQHVEHYDEQNSTIKVSQLIAKGKALAGNETNFDNFQ